MFEQNLRQTSRVENDVAGAVLGEGGGGAGSGVSSIQLLPRSFRDNGVEGTSEKHARPGPRTSRGTGEEWREDKDCPWTLQDAVRERWWAEAPKATHLYAKGRAVSFCPSPCFPHDTLQTCLPCLSPTPDAQEREGPFLEQNGIVCSGL